MPRERKPTRSKSARAKPAERGKARKSSGSGSRRHGESARARVDEELARQKAREEARKNRSDEPFRFRMKQGETKQVIIVDDEPDFYMYEHAGMKNPENGWYNINMQCTRDHDNCPVCEAVGKEGTYNLYLTVIDLTEFEDRNGTIHDFSRKLMVVKTGQIKKFDRRFQKDETLRGAMFEMSRDGAKDPVIGNDIEFLDYVSEDELQDYVREWTDRDGKRHTEDCSEPYDYDELFPEMDSEELAEAYAELYGEGTEPSPGSSRANRSEKVKRRKSRKVDDEDEDEDDYGDDAEYEDDDDDDDDDEPPFAMEDDDDEDHDDEEEEEKPRARGRAKAKPRKTRRRAVDEEEEDPAPKRSRKPVRRGGRR